MPWDYYPDLFAEDRKVFERQQFDEMKNKRRAAMEAYNAKLHRKEGKTDE